MHDVYTGRRDAVVQLVDVDVIVTISVEQPELVHRLQPVAEEYAPAGLQTSTRWNRSKLIVITAGGPCPAIGADEVRHVLLEGHPIVVPGDDLEDRDEPSRRRHLLCVGLAMPRDPAWMCGAAEQTPQHGTLR